MRSTHLPDVERPALAEHQVQVGGRHRPEGLERSLQDMVSADLGAGGLVVPPLHGGEEEGGEVVEHRLLVGHQGEEAAHAPDGEGLLCAGEQSVVGCSRW